MRHSALPLLLLLSGFCGISYEILYSKLLGNLLGQQFSINATILITFLSGLGLGALFAHRFTAYLWLIEAGIGLYALTLSLLYAPIDQLLYSQLISPATSITKSVGVASVILAIPSVLIGCSIPIFAAHLAQHNAKHGFSRTYAIYNIGAVATALMLEFFMLRNVGLNATIQLLSLLNFSIAICLYIIKLGHIKALPRTLSALRFPRRVLISIFILSSGSAIFQLLNIKIFEFIFGPFNETFALVLATSLLGIALGALATSHSKLNYQGAIVIALIGLVLFLLLFKSIGTLYADFYPLVVENHSLLVGLKFFIVCALMLLPAIGFGASIPTLLRRETNLSYDAGLLLFISSAGNVLGFTLMAFGLHQHLDYGALLVFICVITGAALLIHQTSSSNLVPICVGLLFTSYSLQQLIWNENLLYISHKNFRSADRLESALESQKKIETFKGSQDVFAIVTLHQEPYFFINGYISIPLESANEKLVGAISAMLSPRTDNALVLGIGSGATAGTVSLIFDNTEAVEINEVIIKNLDRLQKYNFQMASRKTLDIIHDDAIRYLKKTDGPYSLILNTVTSPQYFSSSKLYTRDFFDVVQKKLSPGGVYVTWADSKVGAEGMNVILKTLDSVFEQCGLAYIRSSYFLIACSQQSLAPRSYEQVAKTQVIKEYFGSEIGFPIAFLPYLLLSTDILDRVATIDAPLNTIDLPVLEHLMARHSSRSLANFKSMVFESQNFPLLEHHMEEFFDWQSAEFNYVASQRLSSNSLRDSIELKTSEYFPFTNQQYVNAAKKYAGLVTHSWTYQEALIEILAIGECDEANTFFQSEKNRFSNTAEQDIGKCYLANEQYEIAHRLFLQQWQRNRFPESPLYLARTLIEQQKFKDALYWLDVSRGVIPEKAQANYLRGIAYIGLGKPDEAMIALQQAAINSDDLYSAQAVEQIDRLRRLPLE
ncbi:hypothetical protein [Luminiphilus sp. nBUS_07]|uniref:spermine/spermidine synthase domain-containing protein n=1 Tax=Luminiphilus sp. nBUS_07 TaxID=3395314 RepID=UPI003EC0238A